MKQSAIKLGAFLGIGALMITASCKKEIETGFAADKTTAAIGEPVKFTDNATEDRVNTSFEWDFGDGTKSYDRNPSHTYNMAGNYTVTQTVIVNQNAEKGKNRQSTSKVDITVEGPSANFTTAKAEYVINETVRFTNTTLGADKGSPVSFDWTITSSNGTTSHLSSVREPSTSFANAGEYTITLTVSQGLTKSVKTSVISVIGGLSPNSNATVRAMIVGEWKGSVSAEKTEVTGFPANNPCGGVNGVTYPSNPISKVNFDFIPGTSQMAQVYRATGVQTGGSNSFTWTLSADGKYMNFSGLFTNAWGQEGDFNAMFEIKTLSASQMVLEHVTNNNYDFGGSWNCGTEVKVARTITLTKN
jgi:PKD repeat protein